ncbi:MAG: hypothetical protein JJV92_01145 [Desulfosarcina sp.]|nr:hypothetical protein [Desulfobacterales bacterium]
MNDSFPDLLEEISSLFTYAEQKIKKIEYFADGVPFPAVNQLRYVAFHLLRAEQLRNGDEDLCKDELHDELKKAKNHCQRAIYDANEAGVVYYLERIRKFKEDYESETIPDIVPNYINHLVKAKEIKNFLWVVGKKSLSERAEGLNRIDKEKDNNDYQKSDEYLIQLQEIDNILDLARPELNKKIEGRREKMLISISGLAIGILAILVTIVVAS